MVGHGWRSLLQGRSRTVLERDVIPAFIAGKRWFGERGNPPASAQITAGIPLSAADHGPGLAFIDVQGRRETAEYVLPLSIKWTRFDRERQNPHALAAVRRGPRVGTLLVL